MPNKCSSCRYERFRADFYFMCQLNSNIDGLLECTLYPSLRVYIKRTDVHNVNIWIFFECTQHRIIENTKAFYFEFHFSYEIGLKMSWNFIIPIATGRTQLVFNIVDCCMWNACSLTEVWTVWYEPHEYYQMWCVLRNIAMNWSKCS